MNVVRLAKRNAERVAECAYLFVASVSMLQAMGSYIPGWLQRLVGGSHIFARNTIVDSYEILEKMWIHRDIQFDDAIGLLMPEMWYLDLFLGFTMYILCVSPVMRIRRGQRPHAIFLSGLALALIFVVARKVPNEFGIVLGGFYVILNVVLLFRSLFMIYQNTIAAAQEVEVLGCGNHGTPAALLGPSVGAYSDSADDSHVINLSQLAPHHAEKGAE